MRHLSHRVRRQRILIVGAVGMVVGVLAARLGSSEQQALSQGLTATLNASPPVGGAGGRRWG